MMMPTPVNTCTTLARRVKPTKLDTPTSAINRHGTLDTSHETLTFHLVCSCTMSRRFKVFAQKDVDKAKREKI